MYLDIIFIFYLRNSNMKQEVFIVKNINNNFLLATFIIKIIESQLYSKEFT